MSNPVIDAFVETARLEPVESVFTALGLAEAMRRSGTEWIGPCPVAGGVDGFSVNTAKGLWNCRKCGTGGHDGIGLAAHVEGLDVRRRADFLAACSVVTGHAVPDGAEETPEAKKTREAALARRRAEARQKAEAAQAEQDRYRQKERERARGIHDMAIPAVDDSPVWHYLERRIGQQLHKSRMRVIGERFRFARELPFWHNGDVIYRGPAMVLPFVDATGETIGSHMTWLALDAPASKYRPVIADPATGEVLPSKKMRGTKSGGLLPLFGTGRAKRWLGGEGIETVTAAAAAEGFRSDTFYFAGGDLGNLGGPADPHSRFVHPTDKKADKNGHMRPVFVPGPVPLADSAARAIPVLAHVERLVLLGDGDSERWFTAAAMARAKARFAAPHRQVVIVWPDENHGDFADWMAAGAEGGQ